MYLGTLFDRYEINFPINGDKCQIIIGENGNFKSHTLNLINKYYMENNKNVLYFGEERYFTLTKKDIEQTLLTLKLLHPEIFKEYGIDINLLNFKDLTDSFINKGFYQLLNFYGNIFKTNSEIVLIDLPETNLHISFRQTLISNLLKINNIKKLIIVTHDPSIVSSYSNNIVRIKNYINYFPKERNDLNGIYKI